MRESMVWRDGVVKRNHPSWLRREHCVDGLGCQLSHFLCRLLALDGSFRTRLRRVERFLDGHSAFGFDEDGRVEDGWGRLGGGGLLLVGGMLRLLTLVLDLVSGLKGVEHASWRQKVRFMVDGWGRVGGFVEGGWMLRWKV